MAFKALELSHHPGLSFAKSLRRHHKDFFSRDVSISVLDSRPMMFSPGEGCSRKM
jgi:hypothetical protein